MAEIRIYGLGGCAVRATATGILCAIFPYSFPSAVSHSLLKFLVCLGCSKEYQGKLTFRVEPRSRVFSKNSNICYHEYLDEIDNF